MILNLVNRVIAYVKYCFKSFHLHGIHSPFIFGFQHDVIKEKHAFYAFKEIESIRAKLLLTEKPIKVEDFGAGTTNKSKEERSIRSITVQSVKSKKYAQLLFRIAHWRQPNTIIELGTSMGLTTAYLAKACPKAKIITIEGSAEVAKVAKVNFNKLNLQNVNQLVGQFENQLESALKELKQVDMVFIDGNHRKAPTLSYFEACLKYAHEDSIFIFDDIYWSLEMESAWKAIKQDKRVMQTVDLYQLGIVFFKKDQAKEHFTVYH